MKRIEIRRICKENGLKVDHIEEREVIGETNGCWRTGGYYYIFEVYFKNFDKMFNFKIPCLCKEDFKEFILRIDFKKEFAEDLKEFKKYYKIK